MTKNIKVISSIQTSEGEKENIELFTEADYQVKAGKAYLRYSESQVSGMEGTRTMLVYDGECVKIKRFGTVNSEIIIAQDISQEVVYRTQYGVFLMTTLGRHIDWEESPKLAIEMHYQLITEGNPETSEIIIKINEI